MSDTVHSADQAHGDIVPSGVLKGIGLLLLTSVAAVAAVRLSGIDIREPDAPAVETRALRFEDRPDGSIAVIDADSRQTVTQIAEEGGFIRGALRALARERKLRGLDGTQPFLLIGRADGRLTLQDPATGQRIDLESFGPMHAGSFARLLSSPPTAAAAGAAATTTTR
jgi:putative photosynthetic complex assembly protein